MAIYRTGKASMDANGIVTGYGTKWRKSLSLIRVGATIIFIDNPAYATIIDVVSDTELRVSETGGAVVPQSNYVILLHDSLSVDGLAQDVAETLRYYQGKENEFAHLIELIGKMDIEEIQKVVDQMKEEVKKFEENFKKIEAKAEEVALNAQHVDAVKGEVDLIHTQTEDLKNQAHSSALQAQSHVNAAAAEVEKAAAEFHKAELEAARAGREAVKAKAEATRAQEVVDAAKVEVVNEARVEVERAKAEADRAKGVVDNAKVELKAEVQVQVDKATEEANRAKDEADRAAGLAGQLDATNLLNKNNNLSDVADKAEARKNLQLDRFSQAGVNQTFMYSSNKKMKIYVDDNGDWGAYDEATSQIKPLGVNRGGTGSDSVEGARQTFKVDRFVQDANMTRIKSNDTKTELRLGQDDWYVYRDSNDSERGYIALGINGGGTGGSNLDEARENLVIDRFKQESDRTRFVTPDGAKSFSLASGGAWGVYDNSGGWIPLSIAGGGTGASDKAGARKNLQLDAFITDGSEARVYDPINKNKYIFCNDSNLTWGAYDLSKGSVIPLSVSCGGTGATNANDARDNLGLGKGHTPTFNNIDLNNPHTVSNSGILNLNRINASNTGAESQARVYHEVQGGVGKITFHVAANGKNRYVQIDENGALTGVGHAYTEGLSCSGWVSANQGHRVGLTTQVGGNKDIFLHNIANDGNSGGWVNLLQGNWYNGYWQLGCVRGGGADIDHFKIGVNNQGNDWKEFKFHNSYGGHITAQRGFKGQCVAGGWALDGDYMGAPFYADSVLANDGGYSPVVAGGTRSTGGWDIRYSLGAISGGTNSWPRAAIHMLGDGTYHRAFEFHHSGQITCWDSSAGIWGGSFEFQRVATSDRDLKKDIEYNDGKASFDNIMKFKPSTFVYKSDKHNRLRRGVIAQDLYEIDPEYVRIIPGAPIIDNEAKTSDKEGNEEPVIIDYHDDTLGLDNNVIMIDTALATRYIGGIVEKQKEEIDNLKSEIEELKALIKALQ